jgi:hypothetical protein
MIYTRVRLPPELLGFGGRIDMFAHDLLDFAKRTGNTLVVRVGDYDMIARPNHEAGEQVYAEYDRRRGEGCRSEAATPVEQEIEKVWRHTHYIESQRYRLEETVAKLTDRVRALELAAKPAPSGASDDGEE